ncbi:MAG TPA: hypothetical protein VMO47_10170, partial [Rhodothermales bacterium]|nr:hypothetical protein [Rhodothermales bacterium]
METHTRSPRYRRRRLFALLIIIAIAGAPSAVQSQACVQDLFVALQDEMAFASIARIAYVNSGKTLIAYGATYQDPTPRFFQWTKAGGVMALPNPAPPLSQKQPGSNHTVYPSPNGSYVIAFAASGKWERWHPSTGAVVPIGFPDGAEAHAATFVTDAGAVIGSAHFGKDEKQRDILRAYRWSGAGTTYLGGSDNRVTVRGVSSDGSKAWGWEPNEIHCCVLVYWTSSSDEWKPFAPTDVGFPARFTGVGITGISPNGTYLTGTAVELDGQGTTKDRQVYRWSAPDQVQLLGDGSPRGVLNDGTIYGDLPTDFGYSLPGVWPGTGTGSKLLSAWLQEKGAAVGEGFTENAIPLGPDGTVWQSDERVLRLDGACGVGIIGQPVVGPAGGPVEVRAQLSGISAVNVSWSSDGVSFQEAFSAVPTDLHWLNELWVAPPFPISGVIRYEGGGIHRDYGLGIYCTEPMVNGECKPPLIVNSTGDASDSRVGDGICYTGHLVEVSGGLTRECTLRAAIQELNALGDSAAIRIQIGEDEGASKTGAASGDQADSPVITVSQALPEITVPLEFDLSNQPTGRIVIDGASAGTGANGLHFLDATGVVRGLVINGFDGYGVVFEGGSGHRLEGSRIGFAADSDDLQLNAAGGVLVTGGATDVTIGGELEDSRNVIAGGVHITGGETRGVRVLENVLEMWPYSMEGDLMDLRLPIDLDDDGPTCTSWHGSGAGQANAHMPPPRVLSLTASQITGRTRPGATVIVYRVEATLPEWQRYFARRVLPEARGEADPSGFFTIAVELPAGTQVALSAIDAEGNTSELSQLRRPVIMLPGIGGTWLKALDGTRLWVPLTTLSDDEKNERLTRLGMDDLGASIEELDATEVLENFSAISLPYGPVFGYLAANGFPGDPTNAYEDAIDVWRFPNDWRYSTFGLADQLRDLVDRLTSDDQYIARSCEVDLVAHSNGGLIGSVYVRKYAAESRDKVNRYVTMGTPYLGTPQAGAAHTRGYIFGYEESDPAFGDVAWGDMIKMTRNVPGAWGLMPGRAYWQASKDLTDGGSYLVDLYGVALPTHTATLDFLKRTKTNADGIPWGLYRNTQLWQEQLDQVHNLIDDWRTFSGPPHVFRIVGRLAASTTVGWGLAPGPEMVWESQTTRSEAGDTDRHRAFRERTAPLLGLGDKTVSMVSATLGRDAVVGATDFSGVDESPWIEEFEYYPCDHSGLMDPACASSLSGKGSLERMVEILTSSYEVPGAPAGKTGVALAEDGSEREVVYVSASGPVAVWVEDLSGKRKGSRSPSEYRAMAHELPEVGFWESEFGAVISLPADREYTVSIESVLEQVEVRFSRSRVRDFVNRDHMLFLPETLEEGGRMTFRLEAGGSADDTPLQVDADGDRTFESSRTPAAKTSGTGDTPPV